MDFSRNILHLRKQSGLSQDDVARVLNITRPAYKQLETAGREPSVDELKKISELFGQRTEDIISGRPSPKSDLSQRQPVDGLNRMKYRGLVLYLTQKIGARPNVGETVLYKLLYFTETLAFMQSGCLITGEKFVKRQYGPVPVSFKEVTDNMVNKGEIDKVQGRYFTYMQTKYLPRISSTGLTDSQRATVDIIIDALGDSTATELSDLSHEDEPWKQAEMGDYLNFDLLQTTPAAHSVKMGRPVGKVNH